MKYRSSLLIHPDPVSPRKGHPKHSHDARAPGQATGKGGGDPLSPVRPCVA